MTDLDQWQKNNDAYLAAGLRWLRLLLGRQAQREPQPLVAAPPAETPAPSHWWFFRKKPEAAKPSQAGPAGKESSVSEADIAQAAADLQAAEKSDPPPALLILGSRLGLSRFEQQVLLLCTALELDPHIALLCGQAQGDLNKSYPTFALGMLLFEDPAWEILSPHRPLRYLRLIEIAQPGPLPLTVSPLRADERIVNYLKGLNYLDDRLSPFLSSLEKLETPLPPSQEGLTEAILARLRNVPGNRHWPVIQLTGLDAGSKQLITGRVAASLGLLLYRLAAEALPRQPAELETFARLWERDALLMPIALHIDAREAEPGEFTETIAPKTSPLNRFLARSSGLFFLDTREVWPGIDEVAVFDVSPPTSAEQLAAWGEALGPGSGDIADRLAGQFSINAAAIQQIARTVVAGTPSGQAASPERVWQACLTTTRPQLEALAQRINPKATWEDIVLPAEASRLLHQIADQVRWRLKVYEDWGFNQKMNRGFGINALFSGESGTGKTMAAEVIANDLGLDLFRIDLSAVVSKYIGQTEKNLRRLFDAAEHGGALLFFDEADSLFGKRSEVKDSHDRYANIEINFLLQRMETYRGLAILATNMKSALDQAFMRRLRFIVNLPFPGPAERKAIWQKVFPPQTPKAELDFDRLARFNLAGGSIWSIAMNTAFLAAGSTPPEVTMSLLLDAIRTELRKLEKPVNEADFRPVEPVRPTP